MSWDCSARHSDDLNDVSSQHAQQADHDCSKGVLTQGGTTEGGY